MKILFAPFQRCILRMGPGQAKRSTSNGPLFGLTLACPACGGVFSYSAKRFGITETGWTNTLTPLEDRKRASTDEEPQGTGKMVTVRHPTGVSAAEPLPCMNASCQKMIRLKDDELTIEEPTPEAPAS